MKHGKRTTRYGISIPHKIIVVFTYAGILHLKELLVIPPFCSSGQFLTMQRSAQSLFHHCMYHVKGQYGILIPKMNPISHMGNPWILS